MRLKRVVYDERGTAKIYKVDEVEIMAKTGTAEKIENAKYTKDRRNGRTSTVR